jgi:hypothetical protein
MATWVEVATSAHPGVHTRLPRRPNLFVLDCDLGVTDRVRLRVLRSTATARADAALRTVEFYGVPPAAGGPAFGPATAPPPAEPVACDPSSPAQSYFVHDCRRPSGRPSAGG